MGGSSTDYSSSDRYDWGSSPKVTKRSARDYAKDDKRSYKAPARGVPLKKGFEMKSESELVLAVLLDVTGSMSDIPRQFIDKMPTLYAEANAAIQGKDLKKLQKDEKLEDKLEIGIVAIGDIACDQYPIQALNYCKGTDLVKGVQTIFPEGGGGGNKEESYDLGVYYLLNHSETPNVPKKSKPLLIIAGDEGFYEQISAQQIESLVGDELPQNLNTEDVLKELEKKFDTYVLRPEISYSPEIYARIHKQWKDAMEPQRVLKMDGYGRLVDCIVALCGHYAGNFEGAKELLNRRQKKDQVDSVLKTLHPLIGSPKKKSKK